MRFIEFSNVMSYRNQKEVEDGHHEDSDSDIENQIHASEDIALLKDHPEAAPLAYRNTMNGNGI